MPSSDAHVPRQDSEEQRFCCGILPTFRRFSADGIPSPVFFNPHVYRFCLFLPISVDFPPIFCLKWYPHPCYKLKHGTPSPVFPTTCLQIPPIFCPCMFCSFSAYFPPNLPLPNLFRRSCLAGTWVSKIPPARLSARR